MLVTTEQMRELDRRTIEDCGVKGEVLMERAGGGVAALVRRMAEIAGFVNPMIHLIAGRGQNGGDVFVVARLLKEVGYQVEVWLAGHINQISGDALIHFGKMKQAEIDTYEIPTMEDWQMLAKNPFYAEIIVDGILGTGISGPARGPAAGAIQYIRKCAQDSLVVSIDIPSGVNGDTGAAEGDAVVADLTATIGLPKVGLVSQNAIDNVGSLDVVDIGIPDELIEELTPADNVDLLHLNNLKQLFKRRSRNSHKGNYGHVLVVGGSRLHTGAASLCSRAALRSGAGLVTALVPCSLQTAVACDTPELMVWPGVETHDGELSEENIAWLEDNMSRFNSVVIGPGMAISDSTKKIVGWMLDNVDVPVVFDADALNVWAEEPERLKQSKASGIFTPHPGELARLLGTDAATIQADRRVSAERAVDLLGGIVVLKGAGTLVAEKGKPIQVNLNGNPGMATGGSGDVLSGIISGFLAQHFTPFDAARCGVFVHGRAGDYGAWRRCQAGLLAGDITEELPYALRDLVLR